MLKSGKNFNQLPEVNRSANQYGQRFNRMARMKPAFLTQRTRTWKNRSRANFATNKVPVAVAVKNKKETQPAAILGTKRADELLAALERPMENSRPILGRKFGTPTPEHCCEKCAKNEISNVEVKNQRVIAAKGTDLDGKVAADIRDGQEGKIRTMTFTNKVGNPKQQQQQQQLEAAAENKPLAAATNDGDIITTIPPKEAEVKAACQSTQVGGDVPYDMCSVLSYALKIMRSESSTLVGDEINSTDSQKLMAVHKRLLTMAIWNNNEEIFDESFNEFDEHGDFGSEHDFANTAKPDSVTLNSCVFFANGKSLIAPPASSLPLPPKQWIIDQLANEN